MTTSGKFTQWNNSIVRLNHPVLSQEIRDIASDCDVPVQWAFDKFMALVFEKHDMDSILLELVAELDDYAKDVGTIPF
jgi:hypothetical protein